jgi:hypothetical protein
LIRTFGPVKRISEGPPATGGLFHFYPLLAALAALALMQTPGTLALTIMCLSHGSAHEAGPLTPRVLA